ncbi:MAG TPA: hydrogenase formation protein HypD [Immundisolibacter sp.]|nr:hydrogenase formation protein HypD [Immundisolibacter sp.]
MSNADYRDPATVRRLLDAIAGTVSRPWTLMEICGGQTHAILRAGIDRLLPPQVTLVHGPGCPVCVTPVGVIDQAIALAGRPDLTLCSFGDMLRVPGSRSDLLAARAAGGDVRAVYSPLDAVAIADREPGRQVVFFAVGFETTAPAAAAAVRQAQALGLANFSLLCAQVRVPPAMAAILAAPDCRIQGFLAAGHVCTVMGLAEYAPLVERFAVPIVITGFEPVDILTGVLHCLRQLEGGQARLENAYARAARTEGNPAAQALVGEVFECVARDWRGLGELPESGLGLRAGYADFDAVRRFGLVQTPTPDPGECRAGEVLQGRLRPDRCPAFGSRCTPQRPLGAPMVSSEGACAAYYRYRGQAA